MRDQEPTTNQVREQKPTTHQVRDQEPTTNQVREQKPTTNQVRELKPTANQVREQDFILIFAVNFDGLSFTLLRYKGTIMRRIQIVAHFDPKE